MIGEVRPSPRIYSPVEDPEVPPSDFASRFMSWISSYFQPIPNLEAATPPALERRKDMAELSSKPTYTSTMSRMTPEELQATAYPSIFECNPTPMPNSISVQLYAHNYRRALFDTNGAWPHVGVVMLWGDMSPFYFPWSAKVVKHALGAPIRVGEHRRDVRIRKMENANHFVRLYTLTYHERLLNCDSEAPL